MVVGQNLAFGVTSDQVSLVTQKVSVANKSDKKEAKDKTGTVVSVAYYNNTSDINIEGLGAASIGIGASLTLTSPPAALAGAAFVDEVTVEQGNEEYEKSTVKGTAYSGISP